MICQHWPTVYKACLKFTHVGSIPANTIRSPNVGSMSAHHLRRWLNIEPTLGEHLVFTRMHRVWKNVHKNSNNQSLDDTVSISQSPGHVTD